MERRRHQPRVPRRDALTFVEVAGMLGAITASGTKRVVRALAQGVGSHGDEHHERHFQQGQERMEPIRPAPIKDTISFDILDAIDVRVGTIERVDDIEGSDKLVKLTVNFGDHRRSILAGMKQERDDPREIEGRQALFVVNLEPKKMMGEVSEGMLFDLGYADGVNPALAVPEKSIPDGCRAG